MRATINWEDGRLRLHSEGAVGQDNYRHITANGFRFHPSTTAYVAAYTPQREDLLRELFGITDIEDDDTSAPMGDRAVQKAERYTKRSDRATDRSTSARETYHGIADAIPLGQPVLQGHHSQRRAERDFQRMDKHMQTAVEESQRAAYWARRAESVLRRADYRGTAKAVHLRIERLEADERKYLRELGQQEEGSDGHWFYSRWLWFAQHRLSFERALYQQLGSSGAAVVTPTTAYEPGGAVRNGTHWYPIKSVNTKSVTVTGWLGVIDLEHRFTLTKIHGYLSPTAWKAAVKRRDNLGWVLLDAS